jgi:FAD binding domain/Berberine and berberine like
MSQKRYLAPIYPIVFCVLLIGSAADPIPRSTPNPDWDTLNRTVNGRLHATTPFALPCFSNYNGQSNQPNADACAAVQGNYAIASFRTDTFSGYMHSQGEICAGPLTSQCILDDTDPADPTAFRNASCGQGNLASYYIEVQQLGDVQAAFEFSKKTGLKLSVKNSGHDYLSRSNLKGTLAIWTRKLQNLSHDISFIPEGCSNRTAFNAITIGAGINLDQAYKYAHERNVTFIGGNSPAVGPSGGFVMGGGHGLLTNMYGLGIDRVLQFKIVTPDGCLLTANACTNPDLFWALRGGGGGTFGVVLESTHRVEPAFPLVFAFMSFPATSTNTAPFASLLVNYSLTWADQGWGGPQSPTFIAMANTVLNLTAARASMAPAAAYVLSQNGNVSIESYPNYFAIYEQFIVPTGNIGVGSAYFPTNRLIPNRLMESASGRSQVSRYLNKLVSEGITPVIFQSPPYLYNYTPGTTSATPAWRNSVWLITNSIEWSWNSSLSEKQAVVSKLKQLTRDLETLAPNSGAYANEADPWTAGWREAWWGPNYPRLLKIKRKYDPHGLFNCWRCVGWEERSQAPGHEFECMGSVDI